MTIKKVRGELYTAFVVAGSLLFALPAFAADLVYQENTTIRLGNGIELVIVGSTTDPSKLQSLTVGATTITVSLVANDKMIIQSADGALGGRNLANTLSQAVTCFIRTGTQKESNLLIYGPTNGNVTITPSTTVNDCTVPTTSASNSVPSGGGGSGSGGGILAPAPVISPTPTSSPAPSPSPSPAPVVPTDSPVPSPTPAPKPVLDQPVLDLPLETPPPLSPPPPPVVIAKEDIKQIIAEVKAETKALRTAAKAAEAVGMARDVSLEKEAKAELKKEGLLVGRVTALQTTLATNFAVYATPSTADTSESQRKEALKVYKENTGRLPRNEAELAQAAAPLEGIPQTTGFSKAVAKRIDTNVKAVCKKQQASDECKAFKGIVQGVPVEVSEEQLAEGKVSFKNYFGTKPNAKDYMHTRLVNAFASTDIEDVAPPPPPKPVKKAKAKKKINVF